MASPGVVHSCVSMVTSQGMKLPLVGVDGRQTWQAYEVVIGYHVQVWPQEWELNSLLELSPVYMSILEGGEVKMNLLTHRITRSELK